MRLRGYDALVQSDSCPDVSELLFMQLLVKVKHDKVCCTGLKFAELMYSQPKCLALALLLGQ